MTRRHLTLTLTITLDEDLCRQDEDLPFPDGSTTIGELLNELRTIVSDETGRVLHAYDPHLDNPTIEHTGITYITD